MLQEQIRVHNVLLLASKALTTHEGEKQWQCLGHKDKMCKLLSLPYEADVTVLNADIKLQQQ